MKTRYKQGAIFLPVGVALAGQSGIIGNMNFRPTSQELAMRDFSAVRVLASQPIATSAEESADLWKVVGFTSDVTRLTENLGFVIRSMMELGLDVEVQVLNGMGGWVPGWFFFDTNDTLHVNRDYDMVDAKYLPEGV